jgi:hypothetical protein
MCSEALGVREESVRARKFSIWIEASIGKEPASTSGLGQTAVKRMTRLAKADHGTLLSLLLSLSASSGAALFSSNMCKFMQENLHEHSWRKFLEYVSLLPCDTMPSVAQAFALNQKDWV